MATTRLRKTFRYPSESDSNSELDEEHQEQLIEDLQRKDREKNTLYRHLFLAIPALGALFFFYTLITSSTASQTTFAVLSLTSLGCTAYILHYMPIEAPARKGKRAVYAVEAERGPVERWLVLLNAALAGLLLLGAAVSWRRGREEEAWRRGLPMSITCTGCTQRRHELIRDTVICGLTMFARHQLAPLDLEELQKARYRLKGV